jgi:hypothetical protein
LEYAISFGTGLRLVKEFEEFSIFLPLANLDRFVNCFPIVDAGESQFIGVVLQIDRLLFALPHDVVLTLSEVKLWFPKDAFRCAILVCL